MALSFFTKPQHMIFVDHATLAEVSPSALVAWHTYDVFFTIQNDDSIEVLPTDYTVQVWHSSFGIGSSRGTDGVTFQPVSTLVAPGGGVATLQFQYQPVDTGHCCFTAQIHQPSSASGGPILCQNLDVQNNSVPSGTSTHLLFDVYWDITPKVTLTVTEYSILSDDSISGPGLAAGDTTWHPTFQIPVIPGLSTTIISPHKVKLDNSAGTAPNPTDCYLDITPAPMPAGVKGHFFHIEGRDDANNYIGEADIRVTNPVSTAYVVPAPYISGGYQSVDIKLYYPDNTEVPLGGTTIPWRWDTLLDHDTDYGFSAVIHNDSTTDAYNTIVHFWMFDGGVGSTGTLLGSRNITVPGNGSFEIKSPVKFHSAPRGQHRCAAVSIYNAQSGVCMVNAFTSSQVPNPGHTGDHSCSAWRNTDSRIINPGEIWLLPLAISKLFPKDPGGPVEIHIDTLHAPADWIKNKEVMQAANLLSAVGVGKEKPLHMIPILRSQMKAADLSTTLKAAKGVKLEAGKAANQYVIHQMDEAAPFEVHGQVPKDAKDGDVFLVKVTANYPKTKEAPARAVEFLQVLHVTNKKRPKQ